MRTDRRRSRRVSVLAEVTYRVNGVEFTTRVSDLSEGGVFVDTPVPPDIDTLVGVRFPLGEEQISAEGRVVYSQAYVGMGIEFTRLPESGRLAIRRWINSRADAKAASDQAAAVAEALEPVGV